MITIKIDNPDKLSQNVLIKKCAFIKFDYDEQLVENVKGLPVRVYSPDTHVWEIPLNDLPAFCNSVYTHEIRISGKYTTLEDKHAYMSELDAYNFKTKPFAHQIAGVNFALQKQKFLLCDEQGLGKTKQIIDWVGCLGDKCNRVLIICGVNSLKYNWKNEIETHSNETAWVLGTRFRKTTKRSYEGSTKDKLADLDNLPDCKFIITNIETLRAGAKKISARKYEFPVADRLKQMCENGTFSVIAADEIHKMKNPTSLQGRAFLKLSADYMCAMSGTPLMNNPLDLFVPLKWLGYEHHSFYQFKQHHCLFGGFNNSEVVGFKNLDSLRSMIGEVMLRRLKQEVLDLPPKIRRIEYVEMKPKQAQIYKEVANGIVSNMHKMEMSVNALSMLIRLRQTTGWTGIVSDVVAESAKMDRMLELVEEITSNENKVVVFSNWAEMTKVALSKLEKYNPAYITGETNANDRMYEVKRFQEEDSCKVIVGTIGALGTGLTLTAAQDVIFLDSPWNRALKDQAEDRCHRIGTNGTVNITTLVCKNTIDERIEQLVERKGKMSDAIVDGKISSKDLKFLLT